MPGITKKDAERLATLEEWRRNHDQQHSRGFSMTQVVVAGIFVLVAALSSVGLASLIN